MPTASQVVVEGALQTDFRLRGYSVSGGDPAASVSVGYDDPSGFYVGGMAAGRFDEGGPEPLLLEAHAGYAARVGSGLSIDLGVAHSQYYSLYRAQRNYDYTEVYVGFGRPALSGRISYSPNYFFNHTPTLYGEINGGIEPAENWFLSAHIGALVYLDDRPYRVPGNRYDWRVGMSRQLGAYGAHFELSGRVHAEDVPSGSDKTAAVLTLTRAF